MQGGPTTCPAPPKPEPDQTTLTLEPLRTEGPDSLLPDPVSGVSQAKLSLLTTATSASVHEQTTTTGDDIFLSSAAAGKHRDLIPPGHRILRAILTLHLKNSTEPHTVELSPPNTIKYDDPADAQLVIQFLTSHKFVTLKKILSLLLIIPSLTAALLPGVDDDDDDLEDTSDDHPRHLSH